jgi:beta-aspartyl-peptidase (threonine type)
MTQVRPTIIVHGGAGIIHDGEIEAYRQGCYNAALAGWEVLKNGGTAMDAVEAAIHILEDDPTFDAGCGSYPNLDGEVEMDAIIMDGKTLENGAIAAIQRVQHPISVARLVMEKTKHSLLVAKGAERFAREQGIPEYPEEKLIPPPRTEKQDERPYNTVGAVALDQAGNLVAGTSTGGTKNKMPGRVGDSPLIGSGCYADNLLGAASSTGVGEDMMKIIFCKTACDEMGKDLSAQESADKVVQYLINRVNGEGGIILIDRDGRTGYAFSTQRMSLAYSTPDGKIVSEIPGTCDGDYTPRK